jgi:hypothetical protein
MKGSTPGPSTDAVPPKNLCGDELLKAVLKPRALTPNVPPLDRQMYSDGKRILAPAPANLRAIAQGIIELVHEHRHLRAARVALLVERSESTADKLAAGQRVVIGRARKCGPMERLLSAPPAPAAQEKAAAGKKPSSAEMADASLVSGLAGMDFIVKLSGDWLTACGFGDGTTEGLQAAAALIDHELAHCSTRIAGEFVKRAELASYVVSLGELHVETCDDIQNDKGEVLVRYMVREPGGSYRWALRRHDLEEFCGVVARWGAWDRSVGRMVDVLVHRDGPALPLGGSHQRAAAKAT